MIAVLILAAAATTCPGATTVAINECMARDLDKAEAMLDRYRAAARGRIRTMVDAHDIDGATLEQFDGAEKAWADYRLKECGAVFLFWAGGTIRTTAELSCRTDMTRAHVRVLWQNWLRYPDSTPPILPDPDKPVGKRRGR